MEAPTISTETELTLAEAKAEYVVVLGYQKNTPQWGWVRYIEAQIDNRLEFLRKLITDYVCKEQE